MRKSLEPWLLDPLLLLSGDPVLVLTALVDVLLGSRWLACLPELRKTQTKHMAALSIRFSIGWVRRTLDSPCSFKHVFLPLSETQQIIIYHSRPSNSCLLPAGNCHGGRQNRPHRAAKSESRTNELQDY
jgi:hypothetical protein